MTDPKQNNQTVVYDMEILQRYLSQKTHIDVIYLDVEFFLKHCGKPFTTDRRKCE